MRETAHHERVEVISKKRVILTQRQFHRLEICANRLVHRVVDNETIPTCLYEGQSGQAFELRVIAKRRHHRSEQATRNAPKDRRGAQRFTQLRLFDFS